MRYRRLTATGDYQFGHGGADFLVDSRECVAQEVLTRLWLMQGEWFLDVTEGTPYATRVLGENTKPYYDLALQERVLSTVGVLSIANYASTLNNRRLSVTMNINTQFGQTPIEAVL